MTTTTDALADVADGAELTLTGRITTVRPRATGAGVRWAVITVSVPGGTATVQVLPLEYPQYCDLLAVDTHVTMTGRVSQWREPVMRATSIQSADGGR